MSESPAPPNVRAYHVALNVDLAGGVFSGTVAVELAAPAAQLVLNSVGLAVEPDEPELSLTARADREEVVLASSRPRSVHRLRFRGSVAERTLIGLYWARSPDGAWATTQCAPTGARRVFPCVDRPDRRAVIHLTVTVDPGVEAISNAAVARRRSVGGRTEVTFEPTPSMATYLFYLGVGRFDALEDGDGRVRLAVRAPPGRGASGAFALERARRLLGAYEEYYGIPYPLSKLDLVAVPEHAFGAMENWGAISFRDMRLLIDATSNERQRRETLVTVAHEIAHQWFGNLVTMGWWTDIWLNESFAMFMEVRMVDRLYEGAGALDDFLLNWTGPALDGDGLAGAHPVVAEVDRPDEISEVFDEISYGKGASVLRMVEGALGAETFRSGVGAYLERHRYGNATSADLWNALESAAGRPVADLLDAWVRRPGYPVIDARWDGERLVLGQRRFRCDGRHLPETWPIPLRARLGAATVERRFDTPSLELPYDGTGELHLNPGALGFYRVLYGPELYDRLLEGGHEGAPADRWSVLNDLGAFLLSGDVDLRRYLAFVDAARGDEAYLVRHEVANQLLHVGAILGPHPVFRPAALAFLRAQLERVGLDARPGEPARRGASRERLASTLVELDPRFARELAERFSGYDRLDPDLRSAVAIGQAREGDGNVHAALAERAARAPSEVERLRMERALASFSDPTLLEGTLALVGSPSIARAHLPLVLRQMAFNPAGRGVLWTWLTRNLPRLEGEYRGTGLLSELLAHTIPLSGLGREEEVGEWLRAHRFAGGERGARKGLERLAVYARLRDRVG